MTVWFVGWSLGFSSELVGCRAKFAEGDFGNSKIWHSHYEIGVSQDFLEDQSTIWTFGRTTTQCRTITMLADPDPEWAVWRDAREDHSNPGIPKWMRSQIGDAQDPSLNPCRLP